jgi:uncharacterized phage infection (PIP) family protein YhgE
MDNSSQIYTKKESADETGNLITELEEAAIALASAAISDPTESAECAALAKKTKAVTARAKTALDQ